MLKKVLLMAIVFMSCSAHPGRLSDLQSSRRYIPMERSGRKSMITDQVKSHDMGKDEALYEESLTRLQAPHRDGQGYRDFQRQDRNEDLQGYNNNGHSLNRNDFYQVRNGVERRRGHTRPDSGRNNFARRSGYQNGHNSFGFRNQMNGNEGFETFAPSYPEYDSPQGNNGGDVMVSDVCFEDPGCDMRKSGRNTMLNEGPVDGVDPYQFDYAVMQPFDNLNFGHMEKARRQGAVQGSYHVVLPNGVMQRVEYVADDTGYKPTITYVQLDNFDESGSFNNYEADGNYDGFDHPNSGPY